MKLPLAPMEVRPEIDPFEHYRAQVGPIEHAELDECAFKILNIGWTLGNDCPYRCTHCYSTSARVKGRDMEPWMVDRIVDQLAQNGIETVNLGGNEPLYTNGIDPRRSLLPYIIERLAAAGILVGLTTAGVTLDYLERHHPASVALLNDVDVSLDSPDRDEHNKNRGARLFDLALRALEIAQRRRIPHTIVMCGMSWNFSPAHLQEVVELARRYGAHVRINPLKPVESAHADAQMSPAVYFAGFRRLVELCESVEMGEPPLATAAAVPTAKGCPCGRSSFRIHSITPDGRIPVSPCVYLHDYKVGDLLVDELRDIVRSPQFRSFRRRNGNPERVEGCDGCSLIQSCRGGCAARAYLTHLHEKGRRTLFARDPYCPREHVPEGAFPRVSVAVGETRLVHQDYLCTWIGKPRTPP
jgi:radical SAM protein with 4Fe4S-binding SPASM domain